MTGSTKVYCYVRLQDARVSGFPEHIDQANALAETRRLRSLLRAVILEHGRSPQIHGHLYLLEVRDFATDNHLCDVKALP